MTNIEQSNEKRQRSQAITQTEWEQYMAEKILRLIRHELYMDFRYMDVALSALSYQPKEGIDTLGTEFHDQLLKLIFGYSTWIFFSIKFLFIFHSI